MLASHAQSSVVRVGVRVDEHDAVHAHSWVLLDDTVILGGIDEDLERYTVLTDLTPSH